MSLGEMTAIVPQRPETNHFFPPAACGRAPGSIPPRQSASIIAVFPRTNLAEHMRVGLFIPCYVDQFYPQVGMATVELLEQLGVDVEFPESQTCCGQPMANTGCVEEARPLAELYFKTFREYSHIVCPSGSCAAMVRRHYGAFREDRKEFRDVCERTYELCEFLVDILQVENLDVAFSHRVGLHQSCHGLRELRMGSCSERMEDEFSKPRKLLEMVKGIELVQLSRPDECCGFGGTFAVAEEAVSCRMGQDRVADHKSAGAEVITAADMSCLMHMSGLIRRQREPLQVMHVAEILAGRPLPEGAQA